MTTTVSDWIVSISGTPTGASIAVALALLSAFMHAVFGAIQKGSPDVWIARGVIDFWYGLMALPFVLFVFPWPEPYMWSIFFLIFIIHAIYKLMQGFAYQFGDYTVVYPIARGLAPLLTVTAASFVFSEQYNALQWIGVSLLSTAIFCLSFVNYTAAHNKNAQIGIALFFAISTGVMIAIYTTYDAYGIRVSSDPIAFLAWFFFIDGFLLTPWVALWRYKRLKNPPPAIPMIFRGFMGAFIAYVSFGGIMLATRLDKVGEAAVLRETSPVFAALIGWLFLKENVGMFRAGLMVLIALGAILIEFSGA